MQQRRNLQAFVGLVLILAVAALAYSTLLPRSNPSTVTFFVLLVLAVLLLRARSWQKFGGTGSVVFLVHLSSGVLFGAFWAGALTAISSAIHELIRRRSPIKAIFNISNYALSTTTAFVVYQKLGAAVPAAFLGFAIPEHASARWELFSYVVASAVYFSVNSALVSVVLSIANGRSPQEVFASNHKGVLLFDLGSSVVALAIAAAYAAAERSFGIGEIGLLGSAIPILLIRHLYLLYRNVQQGSEELLQLMVKAIEARDPYTSGHSLRVQRLSRAIAVELGLPAAELESVERAALLHDVGKIHEEFAPLLRKESRLTDEETLLMQTHSTKSSELVGVISGFRGAVQDAVRHHHERWDGRGYPAGISGEQIPLASRIILVSDTIDAMTTDRPYRGRLPLETVIAELQRHKGSQFDPKIVDIAVTSVAVRRLIVEPHGNDVAADVQRSARESSRSGRKPLWRRVKPAVG